MNRQKRDEKKGGLLFVILAILTVITIVVVLLGQYVKINSYKGDIRSFSFSSGSYFGGYAKYTIERDGYDAIYTAKGYNMSDLDIRKTVDAKELDELQRIIEEYKVGAWDGFDKSDDNILDGSSFSLHVEYMDGRRIDAHGYMEFPINYAMVENEFVTFFEGLGE